MDEPIFFSDSSDDEESTSFLHKKSSPSSSSSSPPLPLSPSTPPRQADLSTLRQSYANTFIAFIGAGILGLPYAFSQVGVMLGLIILCSVAVISTYTMLLLVTTKDKLVRDGLVDGGSVITYGVLGKVLLGERGKSFVDFCLVFSQVGFSIAYLVFICQNFNDMFGWSNGRVVFLAFPALCLLVMLRSLKKLAPFSLIADVANLIGLATVYLVDFEYVPLQHHSITQFDWSAFFFFVGVSVYCYEGFGLILPLENAMQDKKKFPRVLKNTITVVTGLYASFGIFGYLAFASDTNEIITLNMPGSTVATIVKFSLCIGLYLTYPIMIFPVVEILEKPIVSLITRDASNVTVQNTFRISIVVFTCFVSVSIPNFGLFISFVGSSICATLAFILPVLFYLKSHSGELDQTTVLMNKGIMVFGILSAIIGTSQTFKEMMI